MSLRISILVCGRTGVGKSALINCILGKDVCKVGNPAKCCHDVAKAFRPETAVVEGFDDDMNGVRVTVYDSPGLQDGTHSDQRYLDDMYEKCRDVDLVLYCHDITRVRWTGPEIDSLKLLTEKFGATVWNKTILVFTKANCIQPAELNADEKEFLEDTIEVNKERFKLALREVLQTETTVSDELAGSIVDNLPAIPAGSERMQVLPTGPFIGNIWTTCMERLSPKQTGAFMKATNFTKRVVLHTDIKSGSSETPTAEELSRAWRSKRESSKSVAAAPSQHSEESKYILYLNEMNTKRFKKLAAKCKRYAKFIWTKVSFELSIFIPPVDD